MSNGNKYMVYTRDEGGRITRQHRTTVKTAAEIKSDYPNRESLQGWPESEVHWSTVDGYGNGLAPMGKAAKKALA